MADDEIEINPRSAFDVGCRLIVLCTLFRRLFLDEDLGRAELGEETADERFDIVAWLDEQGMGDKIEPLERSLLSKPVGALTPDDQWFVSSQSQAVIVLGWFLILVDAVPGLEAPDSPQGLLDAAPHPWDPIQPWLDGLKARSLEELAAQRELAEIWLWRAEIEEDRSRANGRERTEINLAIRETAIEAMNTGLISDSSEGDLAVAGRAFKSLDSEEQEIIGLTAYHRLRALNWLCGYGDAWSEVPLDV